jgi:hypothetical protein
MSHFSVLVIGPDPEGQLAPYHEFECTGRVDEYVKSVDQLEEARTAYAKATSTFYRGPDGALVDAYDDRFYREPTPEETAKIGPMMGTGCGHGLSWHSKDWGDGLGYRGKINFLPEGWVEAEVPRRETETFAQYVEDYYGRKRVPAVHEPDLHGEHKYGWYRTDAAGEVIELVDRTNPNAQWDWYEVGGRWTGFFTLKPGAPGKTGRPGLMTAPAEPGTADVTLKGGVDFEAMRDKAGDRVGRLWDRVRAIAPDPWETWESVRARLTEIKAARAFYHDQPGVKALRESKDPELLWDLDELVQPREACVAAARDAAVVPYALVRDGVWIAKGKVGWWGCSDDQVDQAAWNRQVNEALDALPDDTLLTIVDCHI